MNKQISPGDLVFVKNDYLSLTYTDAFNHRHSSFNRPFIVLGKHKNYPSILIVAPMSSKFYYNYVKLERRCNKGLEEPSAPSVVLISNNALQSQGFFNGAVLLDQSIAVPNGLLSIYRAAFKEYIISAPQEPSMPLLPTGDASYARVFKKYETALKEWNKCTDKSLFMPKVNLNWFISSGKGVVKALSAKGKMEFDLELSLGRALAYADPKLLDY